MFGKARRVKVLGKCARKEELIRASPPLLFCLLSLRFLQTSFYADTRKFVRVILQSTSSDNFPFISLEIRKVKENKINILKEGSHVNS